MSMTRWHLVTEDFPPGFTGGIASWAEDLATALVQTGAPVTVHARRTGDTRAHDADQPWQTRRMRGRHWSRWGARWAQLALSGSVGPSETVLFASWPLATSCMGLLRRQGAGFGLSFHGSDLTQLSTAPPELHRVIGDAAALLPVSRFLGQELCRLGLIDSSDKRLHVLPMPLPVLPARTGRGSGLLCVARPTALKRVDRVQALASALQLPLQLIGPSTGGRGLLPRAEVQAAMAKAAAVVLLPGTTAEGLGAEGLGLVLIEAAMQGVPVIGCATGGVPEAVGPGLIIDPDAPDLEAARAFLADESAGPRAREWAMDHHGAGRTVATLQAALR
jgi:hypothetical protein